MKRLIGGIAGLILMTNINSQEIAPRTSYYGVQMYQSNTGSGYGGSFNLNANYQKNQRVFELGMMINNKTQKFMGFEFLYKHFLGYASPRFYNHKVKTYLLYNFLYRSPEEIIFSQSALKSGSIDPAFAGGKMSTIEHAFGLGTRIGLYSHLFFDCNAGIGVYLGSKYYGMTPNTWGIHKNNYGFVPSFKFGFGYTF
jgi:hypothetical protein